MPIVPIHQNITRNFDTYVEFVKIYFLLFTCTKCYNSIIFYFILYNLLIYTNYHPNSSKGKSISII